MPTRPDPSALSRRDALLALGAAAVLVGKTQPEAAVLRMKVSGTAPAYEGLWSAVRNARPAEATALKADLATFPAVAKVSGMAAPNPGADLMGALSGKGLDAAGIGGVNEALSQAADQVKLGSTQKSALMGMFEPMTKALAGK